MDIRLLNLKEVTERLSLSGGDAPPLGRPFRLGEAMGQMNELIAKGLPVRNWMGKPVVASDELDAWLQKEIPNMPLVKDLTLKNG